MAIRALILSVAALSALVAVFAVYLGLEASRTLSRQVLEQKAAENAGIWTDYFRARVDDLDTLLLGQSEPTALQLEQLAAAQEFAGVFRFKLFSPDGRLLLLSDQLGGGPAPPDLGAHNPEALEVLQTGEPFLTINSGSEKANRPNWYAEVYQPVIEDGDKLGIVEVYVDVSASFEATKGSFWNFGWVIIALILGALTPPTVLLFYMMYRLRAARRQAQASDEAKGRFLATMSHEIRTPMNGVLGMVEILRQTDLDERQAQFVDVISTSSEALMVILNDVLDISSIRAGAIRIRPVSASAGGIARDVAALMTPTAEAKGLTLGVDIAPEADTPMMIDPARLRQCVLNLVGNAIKFTETGAVDISVRRQDGVLEIAVKDTGVGIPPDAHAKIFAAFEQLDTEFTRRFTGTGLGLAITHELVRLMDGEIALVSVPGQGACFTIKLPVRDAASPSAAPEAVAA